MAPTCPAQPGTGLGAQPCQATVRGTPSIAVHRPLGTSRPHRARTGRCPALPGTDTVVPSPAGHRTREAQPRRTRTPRCPALPGTERGTPRLAAHRPRGAQPRRARTGGAQPRRAPAGGPSLTGHGPRGAQPSRVPGVGRMPSPELVATSLPWAGRAPSALVMPTGPAAPTREWPGPAAFPGAVRGCRHREGRRARLSRRAWTPGMSSPDGHGAAGRSVPAGGVGVPGFPCGPRPRDAPARVGPRAGAVPRRGCVSWFRPAPRGIRTLGA